MKMIWVTFQKAGFHYYGAAGEPPLEDVGYLKNLHRHLFKFKVSIEVFHDDRDIEFHQFLNYVESLFTTTLNISGKSVEMLSDELCDWIGKRYSGRKLIIEVSEDGECGCTCEYKL